ncbi:hypothetical protein YC2023_005288 [Brassica napus]
MSSEKDYVNIQGTSSSWRSPLTSSRSITRCAETASHKANNAQKVPTLLSQNCIWVLTEAGIIALVKNRTFDMTIVIGDGNETIFLILSKQQPGSYLVPTFSLFWVLTGANDVSMLQMVDVAVGISG